MTRLLLAGVALAALGVTSAIAADMPPSRLPIPRTTTYVPFFSWNGLYVGINAGYGWGMSKWTDTVTSASSGNFNLKGAMVGGTAGYNYQMGSIVAGVEGDLGWSGIKGSTAAAFCGGICETKNTWLYTGRGRIGYAFDRFLPYFTGGMAVGGIKISDGVGTATATKVGYTLGGGLEYAFLDGWSAKVEYLYVDLGKTTCNAACSGGNPFDVTFKANIGRVGVNYKF